MDASSSPATAMPSSSSSYWCYSCDRFVHPSDPHALLLCPDCNGGFVEEITDHAAPAPPSSRRPRRRNRASPSAAHGHPPFNPVIVLRRSAINGHLPSTTAFELLYDDGTGSALRPLPDAMSHFLMASGFDRLLAHIDAALRSSSTPASKSAVDSMPTLTIEPHHVAADAHCAVCTDPFELAAEAREMPCGHIYHHDCILPWLALRNSCPVCRHHMPAAAAGADDDDAAATVGLTIWRLPGGGFAVGRFAGGATREELPLVFTEMDGDFNGGGGSPRRISWSSSRGGRRSSRRGVIGRMIHSVFSCFRHGDAADYSSRASVFTRSSLRSRSTSWRSEDEHAAAA